MTHEIVAEPYQNIHILEIFFNSTVFSYLDARRDNIEQSAYAPCEEGKEKNRRKIEKLDY